jgi:hypothetical protein
MKLINKISNSVFSTTDRFFQGSVQIGTDCQSPSECAVNEHAVIWELNQGFEDIVLKDLKFSIRFFVPSFIRNYAAEAYKQVCMFFLVDMVIEEETIDPEEDKASLLNLVSIPVEKKIIVGFEQKRSIKEGILSFQDWFKIKLQIARKILRKLQEDKPYYLLADLSPRFNDPASNFNYLVNHSDKPNFIPSFVFHKRN